MTWFAFQGYNNGQPIDLAGIQEKDAVAVGFHGYATAKDAIAHPNSVSPLIAWYVNAIIANFHVQQSHGATPGGPSSVFDIPSQDVSNWFKSAAGNIASGLESGVLSLLKDLWNVIVGPLEIIGGVALAILIVMWAFRDDLASLRSAVRLS